MSIERRKDLRVACRGTYAELFLGGASVGFFVVGDVSDSGIFLVTPSPTIPRGERVTVRIEEQSLSLSGVIVHVAIGTQPIGYGIQLDDPPRDTVERIVARAAPAPAKAATPPPPAASTARVLIIMESDDLGVAMALSLNAFHVSSVYFKPDSALIAALGKLGQVDVALVDSMTISSRGPLTPSSLKTHVRARSIILYAASLPSTEERRQLQSAGCDQLWVSPLNPFEAMDKLRQKVRKS